MRRRVMPFLVLSDGCLSLPQKAKKNHYRLAQIHLEMAVEPTRVWYVSVLDFKYWQQTGSLWVTLWLINLCWVRRRE